jgi:hypothetical protein
MRVVLLTVMQHAEDLIKKNLTIAKVRSFSDQQMHNLLTI